MKDLIERLEKATVPDRSLFVECYMAAHGLTKLSDDTDPDRFARYAKFLDAEAWTDAALMLKPDGAEWSLGSGLAAESGEARLFGGPIKDDLIFVVAATPAIALCVVALKARAALTTDSGERRG